MSAKRAERLVNLVFALLGTRQYVTAERIRSIVPGYEPADGSDRADEAFKRMFERDKADLRELGVPLETGRTSVFDTEDGYRIARSQYELPEITLTGDEAAAVGLALRLWQSAQLGGAAQGALVKLRAAGVDVDGAGTLPLQPRLDGGEPAFDACYTAARDRRLLTFTYARPDEDTGVKRRVQPWGVVSWHGRWYLVGHDLDRDAPRVFRLSRISGTPRASGPPEAFSPPADLDLAAVVARQVGRPEHVVVLTARPGTAVGLRRRATDLGPDGTGDDRLELRTTEPWALADEIAAHGPDVLVESPPELRAAVLERLTRLAAS
ncbi:helix-turn-helix transcriptional regulator [Klenkia taihuensis]|uniref:Proteasome accessory factor B n=1 Tax=Klenkia taihuensis TaxID=1225127 RepID=A0A1I1R024_9ACTN|nr:WYL domain-containing protein [Klenkia taihuensis]GHE07362.1 WYL domain-containing protein [Klenkia taihuensis]SFD27716.1 proteasome accessory factor B [Klenkia taihuensis]